jgi:hypothetical protein
LSQASFSQASFLQAKPAQPEDRAGANAIQYIRETARRA